MKTIKNSSSSEIDSKKDMELFSNLIQIESFNDILCISGSFFYLVTDIPSNTFQYVSPWIKNVLGYTQEEVLFKGPGLISDIYHPEIVNTQKAIHEECVNFLKTKTFKFYPYYKFSYDLLVRHAAGNYIRLLQHNRFLKLDKSGKPLLALSIFIKIHPVNEGIKQTLHISRMLPGGEKILLKKDFFPQFENGILTKTEIEVWRMIQDGFSSKEIAHKFGIKVNTVNTHRKNIYRKLKNS